MHTKTVESQFRGQVIECFWHIKEETTFLKNLDSKETKKHFKFVANEWNIFAMAFLNDILNYIIALNV